MAASITLFSKRCVGLSSSNRCHWLPVGHPCVKKNAHDSHRYARRSLNAPGKMVLELAYPGESEQVVQEISESLRGTVKRTPFDDTYLIGLVQQQSHHLLTAVFTLLLCVTSNLAAPVLSGILFETLVQRQPVEQYAKFLGIMLFGYVLEPYLTKVYMENVMAAGEKVLAALRLELFRTLLMQRISYYDKHSASELTNLISIELDTLRSFIFNNCSRDRGPRAALEALGAICVLFWLSWRLAPICSVIIVISGTAAALYRAHTRGIEQAQSRALSQMSGIAYQALDNMRTVRSFAGEALERERFLIHVTESFNAGMDFARAKALFEATNRGAIHASLIALYAWGGWLVSHSLMPLRVLISGIGFTFSLMSASQGVANSLTELRKASGAMKRIRNMIRESDIDSSMYGALPPGAWWDIANGATPSVQPYGRNAGNAAIVAAGTGPLELRDCTFSYPVRSDVNVLDNISLTLPRGTVTALVGRSGAGKSTVANLFSRFYEPQSGGVYLAGRAANTFTRGEWARAISLVSQEPVLFDGTIFDNIAYGLYGTASQAEVEAAALAAYAHEFIVALPLGYETVVGSRGALLSGGQRQRVAIARALLKDAPIIILDEATSALDTVSEQLVQSAIQRLVHGRTVLIIAHRLSTVQSADQIVVMKDGKIVEVGTHQELIGASDGQYNKLMSAQELVLGFS